MINLTTGPVDITPEVVEALNAPIISHRSPEFALMYQQTKERLCEYVNSRQTFLMTGSGTMANDTMLYQIKALGTSGLIFVNGEFGNRLKRQAQRLCINFSTLEHDWGLPFLDDEVELAIVKHKAEWILCCHCETSTGQVINIEMLNTLQMKHGIKIFLDCMSTFGTMPINLQHIAMATASTAKGIGSLPGLAMVFSNMQIIERSDVPVYLDLFYLQQCYGIPFTISSNLVSGLNAALNINNLQDRWTTTNNFSDIIYEKLHPISVIPFAQPQSRVFTLTLHNQSASMLGLYLLSKGIRTSFESSYLKAKNWLQIALFSNYTEEEIDLALVTVTDFIGNS